MKTLKRRSKKSLPKLKLHMKWFPCGVKAYRAGITDCAGEVTCKRCLAALRIKDGTTEGE